MNRLLRFPIKLITNEYVAFAFRLYIGWMFIYAGLGKISNPALFAENIAAYQLIPYWGLNFAAVVLPWLELTCGFFMIIGFRTRATSAILASLLLIFSAAVLITILRGSSITCGCFDSVGEPVSWIKLARNVLWFLMAVVVHKYDNIFLFGNHSFFRKKNLAHFIPTFR